MHLNNFCRFKFHFFEMWLLVTFDVCLKHKPIAESICFKCCFVGKVLKEGLRCVLERYNGKEGLGEMAKWGDSLQSPCNVRTTETQFIPMSTLQRDLEKVTWEF